MKHRLFPQLIVMLLLGSATISAQPKLAMQNGVDWGTVVPTGALTTTQSVTSRVAIKNGGDSVLIVSSVRPQCGCTTAPIEKDTLLPGETTYMNITLNLPSGSGEISKYVTIFSNDPHGAHVLKLRAEVVRALQLSSSFLAFNNGHVGLPTHAELSITSNVDTAVVINASAVTKGLRVTSPLPTTVVKGQTVKLTFEYIPRTAGAFQIEALITTSYVGYERIEINGYGSADQAKP